MRLSTRVAHNTIIQITGKVISTVLGLITIAIMTRYLGQTGFGEYITVITFLSFFAVIADFGLTLITAQMISDPRLDQNKILNNLFSLRFISAVILLGLAPLVVIFFPYSSLVKLGVAITALSFFFVALNQIFVGLSQKNLKMQVITLAEIIGRAVLLFGIIFAVYFKTGLTGILLVTVIANAVNFLFNYWFSRNLAKIKWQIDFKIWRQIFEKSWPLALTIMFNLIYLRADILMLSLFKSQAEVGLYGAAYKVIDVLTTIPFMFAGIILPILTNAWLIKNNISFNNILQKSFDALTILAIPLVIGTQFIARPVMELVAGKNFSAAGGILKILVIATGFIFIGCIFSHAIIALDKQKKIIAAYIFTALSSIIGYLIFIPSFSYFGAAWVTVYSEAAIALASFYYVTKYSQYRPDLKVLFKSLIASLIMGLALFLTINIMPLLAVSILAVLIYFITLYLFKGLSKRDILTLLNK